MRADCGKGSDIPGHPLPQGQPVRLTIRHRANQPSIKTHTAVARPLKPTISSGHHENRGLVCGSASSCSSARDTVVPLPERDDCALRVQVTDQSRLFGLDSASALIGQARLYGGGNGAGPAYAQATGTSGINPNESVSTSGIDDRGAAGTDHLNGDPDPFSSIAAQNPLEVDSDHRNGGCVATYNAKELSAGRAQTGRRRSNASQSRRIDRAAFDSGVALEESSFAQPATRTHVAAAETKLVRSTAMDRSRCPQPCRSRPWIVPNFFLIDLLQMTLCGFAPAMMVNPFQRTP